MMGWQWHQLDHMQIICTWMQTDNHASSSSLSCLQAGRYSIDQLPGLLDAFLDGNQQSQSTAGEMMTSGGQR